MTSKRQKNSYQKSNGLIYVQTLKYIYNIQKLTPTTELHVPDLRQKHKMS